MDPHARLCTAAASITAGCALALAFGCATPRPAAEQQENVNRGLAHYDMGVHHLTRGEAALAIRELRAAKEINAGDPWIRSALAEAYRRRGKPEQAEQELETALALDPGYQDARFNLAALYIQERRFEAAIPHLQRLVDDATFPAPWRALANLGWAHFMLGDREQARRDLRQAIDFRSSYWPAVLNLGILEQEEGNSLEALRHFRHVSEVADRPSAVAEADYRSAQIHIVLGQRERAMERLQAAVKVAGDGYWARRSEEYLELLQ